MTRLLFLKPFMTPSSHPSLHRALTGGLLLAVALLLSAPALAHEGHDDAPAAANGPSQPRFTATSDLFELVGVVNGKQLTLYLDHAPTNAPVKDATLEQALPEGTSPVTATVTAGNDSDLLAGELDLHADMPPEPDHAHGWKEYALWSAGGIAALALAVAALRMTRKKAGAA